MQEVFIVSDVHGHYHVLKDALKEAGFDEEEPSHHLLSLGDHFDRGVENKEVYRYFKRLADEKKATCLLGNHDLFLLEFLEGDDRGALFNVAHNGLKETLESFSGIPFENEASLKAMRKRIEKRFPELHEWLKHLPVLIERDDYIFLHGGVDGSDPEWRRTDTHSIVWNYQSRLPGVPGKTIICGHERTAMIRMARDPSLGLSFDDPGAFDIIESEDKVHIDAFTELSKRVNVYRVTLEETL